MTRTWCIDLFEQVAQNLDAGYLGFPISNLDPQDDADTRAEAFVAILADTPIDHVVVTQSHPKTPIQNATLCVVVGVARVILTPTGAMVGLEKGYSAHERLAQRALVAATLDYLRAAHHLEQEAA
jgi:hypothetical protein